MTSAGSSRQAPTRWASTAPPSPGPRSSTRSPTGSARRCSCCPSTSSAPHAGFIVTTHGGRRETDLLALDWAKEAIERGAGELLVNSIDADGTKAGYDLELTAAMHELSSVPVIASGGAGALEHFAPAVHAGADAVLAASVFHNGELTVGDVKGALAADGISVRGA